MKTFLSYLFRIFPVFIILYLCVCIPGRAQDVIIKRNGDEIKAKVEQVLDAEVKYRKFENLTGPLYSMPKADIFMIRYENGAKDVFEEQKPPVQSVPIFTQPVQPVKKSISDKDIRPARRANLAGYLLTIPILGLGITAGAIEDEPEISLPIGGAATLIAAVGIPLVFHGSNKTVRATGVEPNTGLRISSWILYGLTLADALTLIGLGIEYDTGGPLTWTVAGLGALTSVLFAIDAGQVASAATNLKNTAQVRPAFNIIHDNVGHTFNTVGLTITF